jgi:hypothetical protein
MLIPHYSTGAIRIASENFAFNDPVFKGRGAFSPTPARLG